MSGREKLWIDCFRVGCASHACRFAARVVLCTVLLFALLSTAAPAPSSAQVAVGISVTIAPPPLPVYVQPICPGPGYIWVPGYWAWDPDFGYYWVPGTWVLAPYPGLLWTPGYWAWVSGVYVWYEGYWGPVIGFYGGINYGFGYNGHGYYGGYWRNGTFYYNRAVNNLRGTSVRSVYSKPVPRGVTARRVSYNGGRGGVALRPTSAQQEARHRGSAPIPMQHEQLQAARRDPALRASVNRGRPPIAATPRPGAFKGPGVERATRAGGPYRTPSAGRPASGVPGRPVQPSGPEQRRPGAAPRHEAPAAPGAHPAAPRGAPERPTYRPVEPRREQPAPHVVHPPAAPRPEPGMPRMAPIPSVPHGGPQPGGVPRPVPGGGREERHP